MILLFGIGMLGTGLILGSGAAFIWLYWIQMRQEKAQFAKDSEELRQRQLVKAAMGRNALPVKKEKDSGR